MKTTLVHIKSVLLLSIFWLLTACSGGDSGGDSGITLNFGDTGSISGTVDYDNSDFIKMKTIGAGSLYIIITPPNNDIDIDCALVSSVGRSNSSQVDIISDDYGSEVYDVGWDYTCRLIADFNDDRSFYLFVDVGDGGAYSGDYTVNYQFGSVP